MRALPLCCFLLALAGCDAEAPAPDAGPIPYDAGPFERVPEAEVAPGREACRFARGAMPWETIGEEFPIGEDIPIRRWIILMQENRSFDHYFGTMPGIDGIPEGASNPSAAGAPVAPFHTNAYCIDDVHHGWNASHQQYNGGANDGFITTNDPFGQRALGYLDGTDLPFYWDLAQTFAFSDHHFCSVLGPTWVNRMYMLSATSFGLIGNRAIPSERIPADEEHVILEQLDRAQVSWGVYYGAAPFVFGAYPHYALHPQRRGRMKTLTDATEGFYAALENGTLTEVVFIDPQWSAVGGVDATDEHPPANPQRGQAFVRDLVTRVMASDIWPETAILITYDEHGGFYDHVPPPEACAPGDHFPDVDLRDEVGGFDRLGFRVPLFVVSPYSRPGYVSQHTTDLSSIPRLLQARYLLPALTGRDANAWPMLDMFDFESPAFMTPPELAAAPVDPEAVAACRDSFP